MSNYMSQYEEYYKNINKRNNNKQAARYLPSGKIDIKSNYSSLMADEGLRKYLSKDYWFRRIIGELSGAMIILVLFVGLKYINNDYVHQAYRWSRSLLTASFNYDESIEAFENFQVGNYKVNEINIGGITVEDLKSEKINSRVNNLIDYIKNKMIIQR